MSRPTLRYYGALRNSSDTSIFKTKKKSNNKDNIKLQILLILQKGPDRGNPNTMLERVSAENFNTSTAAKPDRGQHHWKLLESSRREIFSHERASHK